MAALALAHEAAALAATTRLGRLLFQENGEVTAFTEKGQSGPDHIYVGVYRISRQALAAIPASWPVSR